MVSKEAGHLRDCILIIGLVILAPGFQLSPGFERLSPALTRHDQLCLGLEGSDKILGCPAFPDYLAHIYTPREFPQLWAET